MTMCEKAARAIEAMSSGQSDSGEKRCRQITSAADLPEELICYCILPCLPFRALVRLATVCKAWRDLILRDPLFAGLQTQSPSPASAALARFYRGRFEVLTPAGAVAADVAPRDPYLSFLPVDAGWRLELCAATGGMLCLLAPRGGRPTFYVGNPAIPAFRSVPFAGQGGHMAGLAYDPAAAAREGYHLAVPALEGKQLSPRYRFWRFSYRERARSWCLSRAAVRVEPYSTLLPRPCYAGGRLHWRSKRGDVVWYDAAADLAGTLPPPAKRPFGGNVDLVEWRGGIALVCAGKDGLGVWTLAGYASPARWEVVHWRVWDAIPGVPQRSRCFFRSMVPAGKESGGEAGLGLAVHTAENRRAVDGKVEAVWRRAVLRYDLRSGDTQTVAEHDARQAHDGVGFIFGYHASMAALPEFNMA